MNEVTANLCTTDAAESMRETIKIQASELERLRASLPEGYALVPVQPTPAMLATYIENDGAIRRWKAMLDAALSAPAAEPGGMADAYVGAREDMSIWKRRALEAEQKVRQQEQIIDHLTLEAQGETRLGEPSLPPAGVEEVEVVGYIAQQDIDWNGDCTLRKSQMADYTIPLMAVAQHQRILAKVTRPADQVAEPDAELVALLRGLVEIVGRKNRGRSGSPNHGHSTPGIWDSDNGDLAGKPCAECALYDLAVARIAALHP